VTRTIVCHCEDIELAEVFSALSQGYCEIESLKRYTGIATGKCQGKCCLVQTLRLLSSREGLSAAAAGLGHGPGEPLVPQSDGDLLTLVRMPTIRQPVLPVKIDDLVDAGTSREDDA
jgi:hypothetical protein